MTTEITNINYLLAEEAILKAIKRVAEQIGGTGFKYNEMYTEVISELTDGLTTLTDIQLRKTK